MIISVLKIFFLNVTFLLRFSIYAPNLCSDRKQFFDSFQNISYNHEDDSIYHYNIVLGDFNCILEKKIDRYPNRRTDDIGKIELQNIITRYDLYDAWRKLNPNKKRYSFQRGNSKSRIDFILCSNVYVVKCLIPI